jgi:nucleoside-diphosphate-sugar epimerase
MNAYGHSKRVFEAMALMYNMTPGRHCVALRIGWVPHDPADVATADAWLQANYWPDEHLIGQIRAALGD